MKFSELLRIARKEPVFTTGLLLAGDTTSASVRCQLSRWVREGRIISLRRGCYTLAAPYTDRSPSPFMVANAMKQASYVSCQSALEWYGLIPEAVLSVTSVTSGRPGKVNNSLGTFFYRHIKSSLLWGFRNEHISDNEMAKISLPEKALLDLVYLEPNGDSTAYLEQLRLQNTDLLDAERLISFAERWSKPKMGRAANRILLLIEEEEEVQ